jgi:hypothetical protein
VEAAVVLGVMSFLGQKVMVEKALLLFVISGSRYGYIF